MKYLRCVLSSRNSLLAAVLSLCFAPWSGTAQIGPPAPGNNYYPRTDAPVDGNSALAFIESLLHEQYLAVKLSTGSVLPTQVVWKIQVPSLYSPDSQLTPALPPLPGDDKTNEYPTAADHYILASDAQLDIALGSAVQKLLDGSAATAAVPYTGSLSNLINSLASYKKLTMKSFVKTATTNILNFAFASEALRTAALEDLTTAACSADPAQASGVVGTMLPLVVPKVKGGLTGTITVTDAVKYGASQLSRVDSLAGLSAAKLQAALNALLGVKSKGGVIVTQAGSDLEVTFGTAAPVTIANFATAPFTDIQTALNATGLFNYGVFVLATDAANLLPAAQDDYVIAFKPLILNFAGGVNRDVIPGHADAADEIVRKAMEQASVNAVAIVNSALGAVLVAGIVDTSGDSTNNPTANGTLAKAKQNAKNIAAIAVNTAYTYGSGYLADEIAAAIGTKSKAAFFQHKPTDPTNKKQPVVLATDIVDAIFSDPTHPTTLKEISLIAAGLMKGFKGSKFEGGTDPLFLVADPELAEKNIVDKLKDPMLGLGLTAGDETFLDNVQFGFQTAYGAALPTNAQSVGQAVLVGMAGAPNELAARLTGAAAWLPGVLSAKSNITITFAEGSFIADVLELDASMSGNDTITDIIEVAVRGSALNAGAVAGLATGWSKLAPAPGGGYEAQRYGQISKGAALGLKGQPLYNNTLKTVLGKIITAAPLVKTLTNLSGTVPAMGPYNPSGVNAGQPLQTAIMLTEFHADSRTELKEITSYAISGALTAGHSTAPTAIVLALTKLASSFYQFYQPVLDGAIDATAGFDGALPASEQWRAVLAVMAIKKLSTTLEFNGNFIPGTVAGKFVGDKSSLLTLIPAYAAGVTGYNGALNGLAITKGGAVINNLQLFPKAIFNKAYDAFVDPAVSGDATATTAVLTGVGLISATSSPLAAALAVKFRPSDAALFQTEATGLNPLQAANIKIAVSTASHVAAGTGDLFDYLDTTIFQNSKYLTDIVTAATVVAPNYAHIIAHAAGFRAPSKVASVVAPIFNFSHITSQDPTVSAPLAIEYDNTVDAASAITAAFTAGILEAKTNLKTGTSTPTTTTQATQTTNLKNAIVALVKQALTLSGNSPVNSQWLVGTNASLSDGAVGGDTMVGGGEGPNHFLVSDGSAPVLGGPTIFSGGFTLEKQYGHAGVITGFMSQVIAPGVTGLPLGNPVFASGDLGPVGQVIGAAIGVVKADVAKVMAIAQAAAQAARGVSSAFSSTGPGAIFGTAPANGDGEKDVVLAVLNAFITKIGGIPFPITSTSHPNYVGYATVSNLGIKPNIYYQLDTRVANAVHFGVLAAANNVPGAGAAGVINYTLNNLSGAPVTDIFGL